MSQSEHVILKSERERGGSRVQQTSSSFTRRGRRGDGQEAAGRTQRKRTQAAEREKYLHPVGGEKRRKVGEKEDGQRGEVKQSDRNCREQNAH